MKSTRRPVKPIAIGSDHAGFRLKEAVKKYLEELGRPYRDYGTFTEDSVDYPEFGGRVGRAVAGGKSECGIVMCGSGIGISIAANKIKGVRAALVHNPYAAALSRKHNDANVLALAGRMIGEGVARDIVKTFLETPFEAGRHAKRVKLIHRLERHTR